MTAPTLAERERLGIQYAIAKNVEGREGRRPARPHATMPVTLRLGARELELGDLPALDGLSDELVATLVDALEANLDKVLAATSAEITRWHDVVRLVRTLGPEIAAAVEASPDAEDSGPVVGVLRRHAGMTRTELAKRIGRHRATVAAWESGRSSRLHFGDWSRACEALGWSPSAVILVIDGLAGEHRQPAEFA